MGATEKWELFACHFKLSIEMAVAIRTAKLGIGVLYDADILAIAIFILRNLQYYT